jgi:hypothetical protein
LPDHVVPVEQGIEFSSEYIRANPSDPHGYTMRGDHDRLPERKGEVVGAAESYFISSFILHFSFMPISGIMTEILG